MRGLTACRSQYFYLLLGICGLLKTSLAINLCDGPKDSQYTGSNIDGSGVYVDSDHVTRPYKFPKIRKCWYDYHITNASLYNANWRKSSGDTYCADTSTCTVTMLTGTQTCQSRTEGVDIKIGLKIVSFISALFGIKYKLDLSRQACYTASNTTACAWDDGACHTVFTSQQLVKQTGYRRKRCNWGDGDETECMADIEINTPTDLTTYQCGAVCGREDMVLATSESTSLLPSTTILSVTTEITKSQTATLTVTHSLTSSSTSIPTLPTSAMLPPVSGTFESASETSSSTFKSDSDVSDSKLSAGGKVGVGFGTIISVALVAALGLWYKKRYTGEPSEGQGVTETRRPKPPAYDYRYSTVYRGEA